MTLSITIFSKSMKIRHFTTILKCSLHTIMICVVMLSVMFNPTRQNVVMLNVIILIVIMLSVIILIVIMLSVIMLIVVAPQIAAKKVL
jgi:hypothetical protein